MIDKLKITSEAFGDGEKIPKKYTCDGADINPPLKISDVPDDAESLVLIVDDPDAPSGTWTHWVVFNIGPDTDEIKEDSVVGTEGNNDFNRTSYGGPCPPSGKHRYFFSAYALDTTLDHEEGTSRGDIEAGMKDHIIAQGELMGTYNR
jgi:hypothetical protein